MNRLMAKLRHIALLIGQDLSFCRDVIRGIRAYALRKSDWAIRNGPPDVEIIPSLREWKPDGIISDSSRGSAIDRRAGFGRSRRDCRLALHSLGGDRRNQRCGRGAGHRRRATRIGAQIPCHSRTIRPPGASPRADSTGAEALSGHRPAHANHRETLGLFERPPIGDHLPPDLWNASHGVSKAVADT